MSFGRPPAHRDLREAQALPSWSGRLAVRRVVAVGPRLSRRLACCPLPNDLARRDAVSWSLAILDGRCAQVRFASPLERCPGVAVFVIQDCPNHGSPGLREDTDGLGDHLGVADCPEQRAGLASMASRQTIVTHDASRTRFNVNGQDHLSKDTCRWVSPASPIPVHVSLLVESGLHGRRSDLRRDQIR